jgi:hypothetical protein
LTRFRLITIQMLIIGFLFLFNNSHAHSAEFGHPLFTYKQYVSIYFFPIMERDSSTTSDDIRSMLITELTKGGKFDYVFYTPSEPGAEKVYKSGYPGSDVDTSNYKLLLPDRRYWYDRDVDFLIFGSMTKGNEDTYVISIKVYGINYRGLLIAGDYSIPKNGMNKYAEISRVMEEVIDQQVSGFTPRKGD